MAGRLVGQGEPQQALVNLVPGLPALPRRLVEKIRANEYVDFAELPPAKGKNRPPSQAGEGQIVVLQAADLAQTRRTIPDLATWLQCFCVYVAVIAERQPERVPELMAYQAIIAKCSINIGGRHGWSMTPHFARRWQGTQGNVFLWIKHHGGRMVPDLPDTGPLKSDMSEAQEEDLGDCSGHRWAAETGRSRGVQEVQQVCRGLQVWT